MRTLERPLKDYFISVGLHEDHKKTLQKDCFIAAGLRRDHKKTTQKDYFISVGLRRDHKKTIKKDCFIAVGLHKDLKKTINDLQVSGAVCPFYFFCSRRSLRNLLRISHWIIFDWICAVSNLKDLFFLIGQRDYMDIENVGRGGLYIHEYRAGNVRNCRSKK